MDLGDAKYTINLDDKATAKMKNISSSIEGMGKKMGKVGLIMGAVGLAIGGVALKLSADFGSAMREVNTMMLLSEDEFAAFKDEVRALSVEMGVSAVDSAHALYQAISAGIPKENVMTFLEVATKAAIGGITDTTTAVSGLTTIINAFKLSVSDAEYVADVMFTTVKKGTTTFPELAASMSIAAPMAAALGVGFEEMLAMVATLTKQGVPTAQAFTQIRAAMVALSTPTAGMAELLKGVGYASGTALIEAEGFEGALAALRTEAGTDISTLGAAMGSVEALGGTLGVTGENAQGAADDLKAMADTTGSLTDATDEMEKTAGRTMETLKAQVADLSRELGDTLMPIYAKFLQGLSDAVTYITAWSDAHPQLIENIGKAVFALVGTGGFLIAVSRIIAIVVQLRNGLIAVQALSGVKGWALLLGATAAATLSMAAFDKMSQVGVQGDMEHRGLVVGSPEWEARQAQVLSLGSAASLVNAGGTSAQNVTVNVAGSVVAERELTSIVRDGLLAISENNDGVGLA